MEKFNISSIDKKSIVMILGDDSRSIIDDILYENTETIPSGTIICRSDKIGEYNSKYPGKKVVNGDNLVGEIVPRKHNIYSQTLNFVYMYVLGLKK